MITLQDKICSSTVESWWVFQAAFSSSYKCLWITGLFSEEHASSKAETLSRQCRGIWGKGQVPTGSLLYAPSWHDSMATLSLTINHTFMQVVVYPSVTLKWGVDTEDNGNVPKSPLMGGGHGQTFAQSTLLIKFLQIFISTGTHLPACDHLNKNVQHLLSKWQYPILSTDRSYNKI